MLAVADNSLEFDIKFPNMTETSLAGIIFTIGRVMLASYIAGAQLRIPS